MYSIREFLYKKGEYSYSHSGRFIPNITGYLQEDNAVHPAVLVVPGGGYSVVSPTESKIVADKFFAAGFHTFILTYTTKSGDILSPFGLPKDALGNQPLQDISRAVRCIRSHAKEWDVHPSRIAACGFSAGSHLTCSLAVHYQEAFLNTEKEAVSNRPDAIILSYPVITSDSRYWHEGSIKNLTGPDPTQEQLAFYSLEQHVSADTPPVFLWHTITDELVPVENSLLMLQACRNASVPCELHLFPEGPHGLSTADENWENGHYGENSALCMEQLYETLHSACEQYPARLPQRFRQLLAGNSLDDFLDRWNCLLREETPDAPSPKGSKAVAIWPSLAISWLKNSLGF